jgi:N-acetylmuramoyl-L-alanine amidase
MTILIYLFKTILISGLLFGYYSFFLKNRPFHSFNRYFLLSIPVLSLLLPVFHFNLPSFWNHNRSVSPIMLLGVGQGKLEEAVTVYANHHSGIIFSWQSALWILSLSISLFFFLRLFKSLRFLLLLKKRKPHLILQDAVVYFVSEEGTPFSFFKSIFWGNDLDLNSESGGQILQHELYHARNYHTVDILSIEILSAIFWFNPFFFLINREIKAIHEYAADAWVTANTDTYSYASLILLKVSGSPLPLTHPFFKNQIKRRIAMMTKIKKNRAARFGRFMIIPLIAILICLFSFKSANPLHLFSSKAIRVVIDAGHGGMDPGVITNDILEKNINLSIAKKIQDLSKEYNVDVIMSREKDELPGHVNDINWSLKYRAGLPRKENADLFISIHTGNGTKGDAASGFEIYVPGYKSKISAGSIKLASCISNYIEPDYTISPKLKNQTEDVLVLSAASVPAILIECGNQNNKSDFDFIQNERNQEIIARDILEGIRRYSILSNEAGQRHIIRDTISPVDTISYDDMNKININDIDSINVQARKMIFIIEKNGKKHVLVVTDEVQNKFDSAKKSNDTRDSLAGETHKTVFTKTEIKSEYPGGQKGWYDYLIKNLKYPEKAVKNNIQGTVYVKFIIRRDGTLTDIEATSGPEALKVASVQVIANSGKWIPAKNNGLAVDSYKEQPINYSLEEKKN